MRNRASITSRLPLPAKTGRLGFLLRRLRLVAGLLILLAVWAVTAPTTPVPILLDEGEGLSPDQPLLIDVPNLRLTLADAQLHESPLGDETGIATRTVPIKLVPWSKPSTWQASQVQLMDLDGNSPFRPDASYTLVLDGQWNPLALPWLKFGEWRMTYSFSTKASPKPILSNEALRPRYQEPVGIQWGIPITSLTYRVSPPASSSSNVDEADPRRSYITLHDFVPGQTYRIDIVGAMASNGISLQKPYSLTVVMPKPPKPSVANLNVSQMDKTVTVAWDEPIVSFDYRLDPPAPGSAKVDPANHQRGSISLPQIGQGKEYQLTITSATAENGMRLTQPYTVTLKTAVPLDLEDITPSDGRMGVKPDQPIHLVFNEAVADRASAERAVKIQPAVAGQFEWLSEREVRFVPSNPFPFESDVKVSVAGGPGGVRGKSGSYLDDDTSFEFSIRPNKLIDVNLTKQLVTLSEGGQVVLSSLTSTGIRGDETPTGNYMVMYKIRSTRMQGRTSNGNRYDVPDVPWVLVFSGDYTIHGAYWRNGFGFPQSAGCVSLPVPTAQRVYEWAPLGTPIVIHY